MKFRLKELRNQHGMTQEDMAERLDISVGLYNGLENGKRRMNADYIEASAQVFGVRPSEMIVDPPAPLRVLGIVGAGARVPLSDADEAQGGMYQIAAPVQLLRRGPVSQFAAVVVEGDSMVPVYEPGEILFYNRATHEGILDEDVGHACVVADRDGMAWVKQVKRGTEPGLFHLLSINPDGDNMHNIPIKWAARVIMALPGDMVERI